MTDATSPIVVPPNSYAGFSLDPDTGVTTVVVYNTAPVGDGDNGGTIDPRVTRAAVQATIDYFTAMLPMMPV